MRRIDYIVLHCTAGNQNQTIADLKKWWKEGMKWKQVGYHKVIAKDGTIYTLVSDDVITNGVAGYNRNSLHVSYFGGIDSKGKSLDNRTDEQKASLEKVVRELSSKYPSAKIKGHRDFSPDKNGDGKITYDEYIKNCPAFDVASWLKEVGL